MEPGTALAVGLEILIMDDGTTKRWGFCFFFVIYNSYYYFGEFYPTWPRK